MRELFNGGRFQRDTGSVKASVILVQINVSSAVGAARPRSLPIVSASVERDGIGASIERGGRCASVERDGEYVGPRCVAGKIEPITDDNKQNWVHGVNRNSLQPCRPLLTFHYTGS